MEFLDLANVRKGSYKRLFEAWLSGSDRSDHAEKLAEFKRENPEIETASFEQAAQSGELIVLCVKGTVAEKIVEKVKTHLSKNCY